MDHPCYKCGHSVEDGKPFCLQCGAPQIRVAMPEAAVPLPVGSVAAELPIFSSPSPAAAAALFPGIVWPVAIRSCALAALIAALVMAFGLMVPLLAGLGAAVLAVNFYRRRNPAWNVNARSGAQLGAVSGILFFGIAFVLETLAVAVFHTGGELRQKMLDALQQTATRSSDPQVQATFDRLKTPEGIAIMFAFGLVVLFIVAIAAGSLAGALTGAFLGRRKRP
jgi:hypothetical protein